MRRLLIRSLFLLSLLGLLVPFGVSVTGSVAAQTASADTTSGAAVPPPAPEPDHGIDRLAGQNRVVTAATVSRATFGSADTVVIARADDYADALAGGPLAALSGGPILLTPSHGLADATAAEIDRLGATRAVLLGGPAALSEAVAADLDARGLDTERIGGTDRFDTARLIASRIDSDRAYVVEGANPDPNRGWPDAVAVAGLAAAEGVPILLVARDTIPAPTVGALDGSGTTEATIVGGSVAVSESVEVELTERMSAVDRVAGETRYHTSRRVVERSVDAGLDPGNTWLVTGRNWPDSLVAGPAAAAEGGVVLLVDGQGLDGSPPGRDHLIDRRRVLRFVRLVGGPVAISEPVEEEVRDLVITDPAGRVFAGLREDSAVPVTIDRPGDSAEGTFLRFDLPHDPDLGDDPLAQAVGLLERLSPLLRIGDPDEDLHVTNSSTEDDGTRHLVFQQHSKDGVPIRGAEIGVHLDDERLYGVNGRWSEVIPLPVEPEVGRRQAEDLAIAGVRERQPGIETPGIDGRSSLEYLDLSLLDVDEDAGPRLAWLVHVSGYAGSRPGQWRVHVDAATGEVLLALQRSEPHTSDRNIDIHSVRGDNPSNVCWFFFNVTRYYNEDGRVGDYSGGNADAESAWDAVRDTYDQYHAVGQHGINDADGQIEVVLDVNYSPNNATYNPGCDHMRFSDGMATLDIFAHEFTHGVDEHAKELEYVNQSGALDESYADVAGATVDADDWTIGEGSSRGTLRDLQNPNAFGDPDHMQPGSSADGQGFRNLPESNDNGGVHTNSGIPNRAFSLMAAGGTEERIQVTGFGRDRGFRLLHNVEVHDLTSTADFDDAANSAISRAQRWQRNGAKHGFTTARVCTVINAYAAVGLSDPDGDCNGHADATSDADFDTIPDSQDNCLTESNLRQADADGDGVGDACVDDDDGDGVVDGVDNCRTDANPSQTDTDGDGAGDACDGGPDGDAIPSTEDNCPAEHNPLQEDLDDDGSGDACDDDIDGDGVDNGSDNAPEASNPDQDDSDGDGIGDAGDNCPETAAQDQTDTDGDGLGDPCDSDDDGDTVPDGDDNCPDVANISQQDTDSNGTGIRCDPNEARRIRGDVEEAAQARLFFETMNDPARIPIEPCTEQCPDWLGRDGGYATTVELGLDPQLAVRVVDETGSVVAHDEQLDDDGTRTLTFRVDESYHHRSSGDEEPFRSGGYELQVRPDEDVGNETTVDLSVTSESGVPQPATE